MDPHIYAVRVQIGLGLGINKVFLYEAVRHRLLVFPGYHSTYISMMINLLPRWHGDRGEVERFAEWLSAMTEEEYGDQMYALIARYVLSYVGKETFDRFRFDLSRVKKGFQQRRVQFPDLGQGKHYYAWLMVQANDVALAKELFSQIRFSEEKDIKQFWINQNNFDYWKSVVLGNIKAPKNNLVLVAAKQGDLEALKEAVEKGESKDINVRDKDGNTPLIIVTKNLDQKMAKYLIDSGADIHIKNKEDNDVLYYTAKNGLSTITKLLIENGVDPYKKYRKGWTSIHYAAANGYLDVIEVLTEFDKNLIFAKTDFKGTALHIAASNGYEDIVEHLLAFDSGLVNLQEKDQSTALHLAAKKGHVEVVKILLEYGADVEMITNRGATPMNLALMSNDLRLINMLKEKGSPESSSFVSNEDYKVAYDHYLNGHNYYNNRKWEQSKSELQKAIDINPYHAPTFAIYAILETYGS